MPRKRKNSIPAALGHAGGGDRQNAQGYSHFAQATNWSAVKKTAVLKNMKLEPLKDAIAKLSAKTPIGSALRSDEWEQVPLALRERAQFSARVESARVLSTIQEKLQTRIGMMKEQVRYGEAFVDRSSFIGDLRKIAEAEGLGDGSGGLTDITSRARLGLIFDMQTRQAAEFARYVAGQDRDLLDAFPAQELIRVEERNLERDWRGRWSAAGGRMYGGRMIALKTDPIWSRISRFGTPYPPFDYGSGMGVEDVSRADAEALGVIKSGEPVRPNIDDFNAEMEASAAGLPPQLVSKLLAAFGDHIKLAAGRLVWKSEKL